MSLFRRKSNTATQEYESWAPEATARRARAAEGRALVAAAAAPDGRGAPAVTATVAAQE